MNPDSPKTPREELELRLTTLLLGELPDEEAAAWRAAIATNPELARLHDRLQQTISLVREATAKVTEPASEQAAPLQLSEERREKLLAHFKTVKPKEFASPRNQLKSWLVPMAATAVLVLLLSVIGIPNFVRSRNTSQANAIINNLRVLDGAKQQWALERGKSGADTPTGDELKDYIKGELPPAVAGETYVLGKVGEPVLAEVDASVAKRRLGRLSVEQTRQTDGERRVRLSADDDTASAAEESAKTTLGFRTWGLERAGAAPAESRENVLLDMAVPQGARPVSTQQDREPTAHFANSVAPKPESVAPAATPPPRIVLPSAGEPEPASVSKGTEITADRGEVRRTWSVGTSLRGFYDENKSAEAISSPGVELAGSLERSESARSTTNQFLGRYAYSAPPPQAGGLERFHWDLDRNAAVDPTTGLPVAAPESGFAEHLADAQRKLYERYGLPASDGRQVSTPAATTESGRDLNRTPHATPPPPPAAAITVNDGQASAFAGRGISPTTATGLPIESVSPDGAALGQTLTETRADPTQTRSYGLGTAIGKGIAPSGGMGGGGGGGGGAIAAGGAANLLAQRESGISRGRGAYLGAGGAPTASQNAPGQVAAGDVVAGFVVTPTPALQPAELQEAVPLPVGAATVEPEGDKVPVLGDTPSLGQLYRNQGSGKFDEILSDARTAYKPEVPRVRVEASLRRQPSVVLPSVQLETTEALEKAGAANKPVQDRNVLVETGKPAEAGVRLSEVTWGDYNNDGALDLSTAKQVPGLTETASARGKDSKKAIVGVKPTQEKPRQLAETRGRPEALKQQVAAIEPEVRAAEGIDVELPKTSQVEIIDRAEPAKGKTGFWRSLGAPIGGTYQSAARVRVEPNQTDIQGFTTRGQFQSAYDPNFVETELEIIRSADLLEKAVEKLNSNEAWAKTHGDKKEETIAMLRDRLDLKAVPNTSLFEIRAKSDKPDEAAAIANAVAEAYTEKIAQVHRELERVAAESSGQQLAEQEQELVPAGMIDFAGVDLRQALTTYSKLTGKSVLQSTNLPAAQIILKAERPLTKQEAIQSLDRVLALNGISMIPIGEKFVKALPLATANASGGPLDQLLAAASDLSDLPIRKPATNAPIPQPETQTSENAFSTFSLNVSDVSFKLATASLEKGQMPDPASIRSEEFINAFDYRDPEPPPGMPVAFAWERARYPFAHNRDLLRFSLKTGAVGRQAGRALNIVLLLDNSGSMERADRVHIIREALRVLADQLQPQDKISVITFARTPRLVADGVSGDKAGEVTEQVSGLTPQGGTNLEEAMNLAYQTALRHYVAGGINRVVVLTDGAANLGNVQPESLKQRVEAHRKQGIALDCFGIGWEGFNDDLLEILSRNGDGRYGFINSPEEAATEFAGQLAGALQVAASDVKVQVEFNPARVTAYRQIGYAKHQLTKEQFRDNTVDAAEIAAQEAGNALYTVEVNPAGEGPLCIVRVRFKFPGTVVYREHEWAVPYNGNAVSLEQASPAMRLAASAGAFSEWLVASPFAAEVTPDALLGYLSGVPEVYGADARPKKLEWMIRQAKSIEGK